MDPTNAGIVSRSSGEPWAGSSMLVSIWLMFSTEEFTLQDANLPWVSG